MKRRLQLSLLVFLAAACGQRPGATWTYSSLTWTPIDSGRLSPAERRLLKTARVLPLSDDTSFLIAQLPTPTGEITLVRGVTGRGTGWHQEAFLALADRPTGSAIVWSAIASDVGDPPGEPPYELRGCLYAATGQRLAYYLAVPPNSAAAAAEAKDSLGHPSGIYEWKRGILRQVGQPDSILEAKCRGPAQ
jgi:hypothetical protein